MTMKKKLAIALCSMPLAMAPIAYAQTGGATEGTTSPQSGTQTDMGADGAPNRSGSTGATNNSSGSAGSGAAAGSTAGSTGATGAATRAATGASASTPSAVSGESFEKNLRGKSVYNESDEKVGDIKDAVLSADGQVTHVVLGVGGFIGVGEHPVAIPFNEINTTGDKLTLRGYTKDQLKDMPAYERPRDERTAVPGTAPAPMGAPR